MSLHAHLRQSDIIPQVNTDIIVSILFEYNVNFNSLLPAGLTEIDLSNPPDVDEIVCSQLSKSFENEYNKIKATAKIVSVGNNKLMHFDEPCAYVSPYTHEVIYETDTTAYLFPADIAGDSNLFLEALSNILRSNPSAFNCFPEAKKTFEASDISPCKNLNALIILRKYNPNFVMGDSMRYHTINFCKMYLR